MEETDLIPLGEALDALEVKRLRNLIDGLLRHTGGVPKECPHCGTIVRDAVVVVGEEGDRRQVRVLLEDGGFVRHTRRLCPQGGC